VRYSASSIPLRSLPLADRIENVRTLLNTGVLPNEAAVSHSIVNPLLQELGWPLFDPTYVAPQFKVEGRWVDFALLHHGRPVVFIEVKQPGRGIGADKQLFEYAFHGGVPLAVLTDGATWHFYLPAMQGTYDERRVYLLDLLERDPAESAVRLTRYLDYGAVTSGEAFERARQDYQRSRQRREAREAIPSAWQALIEAGDERLVEVLASEVESRSGFFPEPEDILGFLAGLRPTAGAPPMPPGPKPPPPPTPPLLPSELPAVGFSLTGTFVPGRNGRDVLMKMFQALAGRDPAFLDRFIALPEHGRRRRYVARSREALFPGRPDLAKHSTEVRPGYWLGTNNSASSMEGIIRMACEVAGLRFGEDVKVRLG
jgi:hypothetical protein